MLDRMRPFVEADGISVKAFTGTTGILLAFDANEQARDGLLGFAVKRTDLLTGKRRWLENKLVFPGRNNPAGAMHPTNEAPLQRFRWGDWATRLDRSYRYEIHPAYGTPDQLELRDGPTLEAKTSALSGPHAVLFNRAAASSQAFSRQFPEMAEILAEHNKLHPERHGRPPVTLPAGVREWLSRGVLELIVDFIRRAGPRSALDIAIYEYEQPQINEAVEAAVGRGASVRIVYHAKRNDEQTEVNERALSGLPAASKRGRVTNAIFHNKYVVLSDLDAAGKRRPRAVLCGSTNFTDNGVYRQANVVHVLEDEGIAGLYLNQFEPLWDGDGVRATKAMIDAGNPIATDRPIFAGFSPRSARVDLEAFAELIGSAKHDVIFVTAFPLDPLIKEALLGTAHDRILRFGMQNKSDTEFLGVAADRTADFAAAAQLEHGLEGWLKETTAGQRGSNFIHCKLIIIDATSSAPRVLSGSHNLSNAASANNDENWLLLDLGSDVADRYTVEALRVYEHYRFRFVQAKQPDSKPPSLKTTADWTDPYYGGDPLRTLDRQRFAARET